MEDLWVQIQVLRDITRVRSVVDERKLEVRPVDAVERQKVLVKERLPHGRLPRDLRGSSKNESNIHQDYIAHLVNFFQIFYRANTKSFECRVLRLVLSSPRVGEPSRSYGDVPTSLHWQSIGQNRRVWELSRGTADRVESPQ